MDDLEERLRTFEGSDDLGNGDFSVCRHAADHLRTYREALSKIARGEYDGMKVTHLNAKGCRQIAVQALKG